MTTKSGANYQPSPASAPVTQGAILADIALMRETKPPAPPLTLREEIVALLKEQRGLCQISAHRFIREHVAAPSRVAAIADERLRMLVGRFVRTGGWI